MTTSKKPPLKPGQLVKCVDATLTEHKHGVLIKRLDQVAKEDLAMLTNETHFLDGEWLEILVNGNIIVVSEAWCEPYDAEVLEDEQA